LAGTAVSVQHVQKDGMFGTVVFGLFQSGSLQINSLFKKGKIILFCSTNVYNIEYRDYEKGLKLRGNGRVFLFIVHPHR
jgi:hypothetical protein